MGNTSRSTSVSAVSLIRPPSLSDRAEIGLTMSNVDKKTAFWKAEEATSVKSPIQHSNSLWKPLSLRKSGLVSIILATIFLLGTVSLLHWLSLRRGGLFFASTSSSLPLLQSFVFRYLPVIVTVLYGIAWNWIDLDIRRLEPWYQLSQKEGISADKSMLLQYPVEFLPFVPVKAGRRKQWSVAISSTVMILVAWAVTPLQSGIFNFQAVQRQTHVNMQLTSSLPDVQLQTQMLNASFMNVAFSNVWFGQQPPQFTTKTYAIAPFRLSEDVPSVGQNRTLSAKTTMYSAELHCHSATTFNASELGITIGDGNGCLAQNILPAFGEDDHSEPFTSYFIGYFDDPRIDESLELAQCPLSYAHTFLAVWKQSNIQSQGGTSGQGINAMFCSPSYYSTLVNATVAAEDKSVISTTPVAEPVKLTEQDFNLTQFEFIIANGGPPGDLRKDIIFNTPLDQSSLVANMSLDPGVSNIVAFAIGETHHQPEDYLNPSTFAASLQSAYQLLFSLAVNSVMFTPLSSGTSQNSVQLVRGETTAIFQAVKIEPAFAILVEVAFILVILCTCRLLHLSVSRPLNLLRDPGTLSEVMLLSSHFKTRNLCSCLDQADDSAFSAALSRKRYLLRRDEVNGQPLIDFDENEATETSLIENHDDRDAESSLDVANVVGELKHKVQPREYNRGLGLFMVLSIGGLILFLIFLRRAALGKGLQMPSNNNLGQQILLNIIPTIVGTIMEPFWVLLSRIACIMQPFQELRKGRRPAHKSLLTTYGNLPPQLALWKACRSREFVLGLLCGVAVLANVLTVALSGLFSTSVIQQKVHAEANSLLKPNFKSNVTDGTLGFFNTHDCFNIASVNFSSGANLPAWVSPHYYFLPMNFKSGLAAYGKSSQHLVSTTGYGADLDCVDVGSTPASISYQFNLTEEAIFEILNVNYLDERGETQLCSSGNMAVRDQTPDPTALTSSNLLNKSNARGAVEIWAPMTNSEPDSICGSNFVMGWSRWQSPDLASLTFPQTSDATGLHNTFISCKPRLKTASFNVLFDSSGLITNATQTSATATYHQAASKELDLFYAFDVIMTKFKEGIPVWHNDTFTSDWMNYLIKTFTKSNSLIDATLPPPSASDAAILSSEVFSRLFAIQLSLMSSHLEPAENQSLPIDVFTLYSERRVFISTPFYWVSIAILALDLFVLVFFYGRIPKPFLPRLSMSIASQMAYFAGSRIVEDVQAATSSDEKDESSFSEKLRALDKAGWRYGYGKYIGSDGCLHVGIERHPFVTSLDEEEKIRRRQRKYTDEDKKTWWEWW